MGGGDGSKTAQGKLNHGGHWRAEREWPPARTRATNYYLKADGSLSPEIPRERPKTQDPNATADGGRQRVGANLQSKYSQQSRTFSYDPAHPVPTLGGTVTGFMEEVKFEQELDPFWEKYFPPWARMRSVVVDGPMHQQEKEGIVACRPPYLPLAMRPDVLVFETPPLTEDVELTGNIVVNLWISSSAVDTDFTAKLIDVYPGNTDYPSGYHLLLTDSIIRCRYRDSFERETLMKPGEIVKVQIVCPPTSNLYKAGHRIRLDISSSNFPRFDLNPNTGEPIGRHTHMQIAHNTVYCDEEHPSHAILPIIP
jgi:predicted acyl esterase